MERIETPAPRLKERCSNFIVTNIDIANKVLGVDATTILKRSEGKANSIEKDMIVRCKKTTIWWIEYSEYTEYTAGISRSVKTSARGSWYEVKGGTVGRIVDRSETGMISVKWNSITNYYGTYGHPPMDVADMSDFEILTPPIDTNLFKD